jgi:hypothetical protein
VLCTECDLGARLLIRPRAGMAPESTLFIWRKSFADFLLIPNLSILSIVFRSAKFLCIDATLFKFISFQTLGLTYFPWSAGSTSFEHLSSAKMERWKHFPTLLKYKCLSIVIGKDFVPLVKHASAMHKSKSYVACISILNMGQL